MTVETGLAAAHGDAGMVVIERLHRLVRHGWRPLLGYARSSGQDGDVHLRQKRSMAVIQPDGTVFFSGLAGPRSPTLSASDREGFDAAFPPEAPNKRNLTRRLYEMGL